MIKMKKLASLLAVAALLAGTLFLIIDKVYAAAPGGTLTGTAITVNIGEIKPINTLTVTAASPTSDITAANDIYIKIPDTVNAYWDVADTTPTFGEGASSKVSSTVSYPEAKTLKIDVTTDFAAGDILTIADLSYIGYGTTSAAAALTWSVDGGITYGTADSSTAITVAKGTQDTLGAVAITPPATNVVSATNVSYAVVFDVPTGGVIPKDGKIKVTFPSGFNVASPKAGNLTGIDGTVLVSVSGQDITFIRQNDGTNATAGTKGIVVSDITNPAIANSTYTVTVTTQTSAGDLLATGTTGPFSVNPVAIADLTCDPSGQAGAVWLRWTTPLGTSAGYEVKYQQGNSITYDTATTFSQSWSSGTAGTSQQQLVTGLNPNTQYTFAMKAKGAGTSISAISALTPSCYAPGSSSSLRDSTPPTSYITQPAHQSTILAGQAYTIKGTASDTGGSSVAKVEVSLDNGNTWSPAVISSEDTGTNRVWQYVWYNPQVGTYTLKSRAYDWVGNIETPASGVTVTVATTLPLMPISTSTPTTTPTPTPTPPTPATGSEAIRAQIMTLQMKLIELLQQLLALLRARLGL